MQHTIIIGGGLGGLFCGALLAKAGRRVTVLEKNHTIGGGLQSFRRFGLPWETGMHLLGGLRPGQSIWRICKHLGVADALSLRDIDSDCMDEVHYLQPGLTFRLPAGREAFGAYLKQQFPAEAAGIDAYLRDLYDLAQEVDLFWLRPSQGPFRKHSPAFLQAADEFIAAHVTDPRLRDLLAYMNPMYGGVAGHTPAYIHALINVLYIDGPSRFIDGSQQLADALAAVISEGGGKVLRQARATSIDIEQHRATAVHAVMAKGVQKTFPLGEGDTLVSAIHPAQLLNLCPENAFTPAFRKRIATAPNSYSAFVLYIVLRPGAFPYINHTCYVQDDFGMVWRHASTKTESDRWPSGFMYMTCADPDPRFARKIIVNCVMPWSEVERWQLTTTGHRTAEYKRWKLQMTRKILRKLQLIHPNLKDAIQTTFAATPLTIRDYYATPNGSLYGLSKDCRNIMQTQLPVRTKVNNLLLTGQSVNLHGICGTPLTAIQTAEALLGENTILSQL